MDLKNKTVLVTGAGGFIGSHLTEMLTGEAGRVRALCRYNSRNHWGWLEDSPHLSELEVLCGDVRDPHFVKKAVKGADVVFHLAALIAIPYSYEAPASYVDVNVSGTLNVCQAALEAGCARVVHTSTSEVYGTARTVPISEDHPLQPQSPYSASKIGADMMAFSFHNSFSLPVTVVRPFNTFGPRQSARAVIPTIITQAASGHKELRLGDTTPTRDFNFVADTCRGFIELARCDDAVGQVVNVGSGREISIGQLAEAILKILGKDLDIRQEEARLRPENSEVKRLLCDNARLKKLTGFTPGHTLMEGLEKTVSWFLDPANLARYKAGIYNV